MDNKLKLFKEQLSLTKRKVMTIEQKHLKFGNAISKADDEDADN